MFFVEGMMAVVAGIAALFFLVDSPQKAKFLTDDEKFAMKAVMDHEDSVKDADGPRGILPALLSWKVWYFTVIYFCLQIAVYGTTFYLPQQVGGLLGKSVGWEVGLVSAIPWVFGLFVCYYVGKNANTIVRRRTWGTMFFLITGAAILFSAWAGANGHALLGIAAITVAVSAFLSTGPITWSFPTSFLAEQRQRPASASSTRSETSAASSRRSCAPRSTSRFRPRVVPGASSRSASSPSSQPG